MFEFQALCNVVEALAPAERAALIAEKSISVVEGLHKIDFPADPIEVLASFVVGSVLSDGSFSEKDFLNIYPAVTQAFGELCDIAGIERKIKASRDAQKEIKTYTTELIGILAEADETLGSDIVLLCLLVTSADGKVSLKERRYIKQLCKG